MPRICKSIGCNSRADAGQEFCYDCIQSHTTGEPDTPSLISEQILLGIGEGLVEEIVETALKADVEHGRNTGGNVNYYVVPILQPKRLDPYTAECEDIIEALGMNFAEGCAFKAIWRRCAARTLGNSKRAYDGGAYDAEKAQYYTGRMVEQDKRIPKQ